MTTPDRTVAWAVLDSPIEQLLLTTDGVGLSRVWFAPFDHVELRPEARDDHHPVLAVARRQLDEYFAGERRTFDVPLSPGGTPFQNQVWDALRAIPYGETASYVEVARAIGRPTASRAVGAANGRNPIAVIVPCHRVIGSNGLLVGYAGGAARKRRLLDLETGALQLG
ncbi:methylated-DNA--[protein]-cysteine S-methyltransferase [Motilibacter aurantiacus]|uniref:methylated-DNA--[protein]-cysteine S-methyltransferase n=1 Tax=Motilibacter aurantiacus TaxID=2714955 RepID=UPI00140DF0A9|nr:methylated-DNA--[protein]-cysteine S-methyltransferase [Motilibacter aurantiacus]NHC46593.1 methylated-DNA--[protein]-cysteine S-methyltransferase [Motilibacter aurantiacus]